MANALAMANALVLLRTREYVGGGKKREIAEQYRLQIGDQWAALVQQAFADCRGRWNYAMPAEPDDRQQLSGLCEQALAFENHFLLCYKDFLLAELAYADDLQQLRALRGLGAVMYRDPAVLVALQQFAAHPAGELRQVIAESLRHYRR